MIGKAQLQDGTLVITRQLVGQAWCRMDTIWMSSAKTFLEVLRESEKGRSVRNREDHVGVLWNTSAWFCKCIVSFKVMSHLGWGQAIGWSSGWWRRCLRWKCFLRSPWDAKVFNRLGAGRVSLSRHKMHCVAWHSIDSIFDRLSGEVCSFPTVISVLRRRKPWLSYFLQRAINAFIAVIRRWHSFFVDDVAKVESASMTWTLFSNTYSAVWRDSCSVIGNPFNCRWMSIIGCFFLYLSLTFIKRIFSCRRLKLRWAW